MEKTSLKSIQLKRKYNFEITRMELKQNEFGKNDIVISQVKVLDENGKYIKFAKLNESLISALKNKGIISIKKD